MTMLHPRREVGEFKKRYKWMAFVVLISFGVLIARMLQLQIVEQEEWQTIAQENITKEIELPATRGIIRDTDGRVLASNEPSYAVYVTPQLLDPDRDVQRVAELMGLSKKRRERFEQRLEDVPAERRTHQIEMFNNISRKQLAALETHSSDLPGVDVVSVPHRSYPYETLGAHTIGYLNEVSAEDLERLEERGYERGDLIGRLGVERAWESYLRGESGLLRVPVDVEGRVQHAEGPTRKIRRDPVPGRDLNLTLDMKLMRTIERAFRGHPSGAAVVLEVGGRVRALYSKPSYDLNRMTGGVSEKRYRELKENPFRPLIDKTVFDTYFPGSTFKPFSALAALGDEALDPSKHVDCPGYYELGHRRFRCTQAHGEVGLHNALVQSCNVYFYKLGERVGINRLAHYAHRFGLGKATGIGINSEASGFIATRDWYVKQWGAPYRLGFTLNAAIGQGNTRTTLLQIASAYAAISNRGRLYVPQLVERVTGPDGTVIEEFEPRLRREVDIQQQHLDYVLRGLDGVVNNPDGTAYDARVEGGVRIAGKTGTAEVAQTPDEANSDRAWYYNRDHAWFVGLAPAGDPEVVAVVLVEHGGAGGKTAAPIGIHVLEEYLGRSGGTKRASAASKGSVLTSRGDR